MVLAETETELPFDIADVPAGRMSLTEPETVDLAVRAMLPRLRSTLPASASSADAGAGDSALRSHPSSHRRSKTRTMAFDPSSALQELRSLRSQNLSHAAFEKFVAGLFSEAGYLVSSESTTDDRGVDLTLWLDEVAPIFNNPVLVEIKGDLNQRDSWTRGANQLRRYLAATGATCGLLVSLTPLSGEVPDYAPSLPFVTTFSVDDLVPLIASGDLSRELIRRRNLAVHGVAG